MLVLTRLPKVGQDTIVIGDDIRITVVSVKVGDRIIHNAKIRLGIEAARHIAVVREELIPETPDDSSRINQDAD